MDVSEAHHAALGVLLREDPQLLTLNLGTGRGVSVLKMIAAFEEASSRSIPYRISDRRTGDAAIAVADPSLAACRLGWQAKRTLKDICRDGWNWLERNSHNFEA